MAKIEKREVIQKLIEGLRLSVGAENVPQEVEDKIRAVFITNEENIVNVLRNVTKTTTGSATMFTVPSDKDFFLTGLTFSYTCDATADSIQYILQLALEGDAARSIVILGKQTTTATTDHIELTFPVPLKLESGTTIAISQTFTVGTSRIAGSCIGYTKEL